MGLLQLCEEFLKKCAFTTQSQESFVSKDSLLFEDLCSKYGFLHAALLRFEENVYVIEHAFCISASTACHSISTKTFWQGTLPCRNKWYIFEKEALHDFFQLFDKDIVSKMKSLALIRLANVKEEQIFIVYNTTTEKDIDIMHDTAEFSDDVFHLCHIMPPCEIDRAKITGEDWTLAVIPVKDAVENSLGDVECASSKIIEHLKTAIFEEVYRIICKGLGEKNIVGFNSEKEIKVAIKTPQEVNEKLYLMHIQNACQKVIGKFAVQFMSFLEAGTCKNEKGLKSFIL